MTEPIPPDVAPVMGELERGMRLRKCRKCGCMRDALERASRAFLRSDNPEIRALLPVIEDYQARMEPIAYDCIGCKKCFGADATIQLAERFDEETAESCGSGCALQPSDPPLARLSDAAQMPWPPYPGDYLIGNPCGSVAVCTLSSRELALPIIKQGEPGIAIAGRCDTENIGVEKVVLNILANPRIRWLLLCGVEAQGHRTGDAFLRLKERGVDADMRVLESAAWRPVLKNLTLLDVARFREQVQIINLIGETRPDVLAAAAREAAAKSLPALDPYINAAPLSVERIQARAPKRLRLDPSGFFIIIPNPETRRIVCEHYENNGRLAHVIEGRQAALIASTLIERGLVSQLDHAAYLGRELAKAEMSLRTGASYEQDAALGNLPPVEPAANDVCENSKSCSCR